MASGRAGGAGQGGRSLNATVPSWIGWSPVGAHLGRWWTVLERLGEESASGREIPLLRDEDVDDLAELVDRPVQIDPSSGHFDVHLIDKPPITGGVPAGTRRVDQQRGEPLHPPIHAHVINLDAPLDQQLLPITVGRSRSADTTAPPR
jgi:hypothetical protein